MPSASHSTGSSPRLRGTLTGGLVVRTVNRFIPAPAGNTGRANTTCSLSVHPRACGEHSWPFLAWPIRAGSSPRLRGTPYTGSCLAVRHRFIPAPAGNTVRHWRLRASPTVHPRACGEHAYIFADHDSRHGSSPRLRGTPGGRHATTSRRRFIPAPAGNTFSTPTTSASAPVHPRACGEHEIRGPPDPRAQRFIPAPAGNTSAARTAPTRTPVHPRACGEHFAIPITICASDGSSPRLRGTREEGRVHADADRFIPAPAGNTAASLRFRPASTVHPRACGEHQQMNPLCIIITGSSPRLRGTLQARAGVQFPQRFIPAPAGNTGSRSSPYVYATVHPRACGEHTSRKMFRGNNIFPVKERTGGFLTDGDSDEQVESAGLSTNSPCPFRRVDRARNLRASFRPGPPGSADWHHRFQRCSRCRLASPRR